MPLLELRHWKRNERSIIIFFNYWNASWVNGISSTLFYIIDAFNWKQLYPVAYGVRFVLKARWLFPFINHLFCRIIISINVVYWLRKKSKVIRYLDKITIYLSYLIYCYYFYQIRNQKFHQQSLFIQSMNNYRETRLAQQTVFTTSWYLSVANGRLFTLTLNVIYFQRIEKKSLVP